jgi:hypothetical protein
MVVFVFVATQIAKARNAGRLPFFDDLLYESIGNKLNPFHHATRSSLQIPII